MAKKATQPEAQKPETVVLSCCIRNPSQPIPEGAIGYCLVWPDVRSHKKHYGESRDFAKVTKERD